MVSIYLFILLLFSVASEHLDKNRVLKFWCIYFSLTSCLRYLQVCCLDGVSWPLARGYFAYCLSRLSKSLYIYIYNFRNSLSECRSMIWIEPLWASFYVKEGEPSGTWTHDLRLSVPTLLPTELSVRQWNWSIRDSLYSSLCSSYSGIHTVIELLDYTYLFLSDAFRTIVGLIACQLGNKYHWPPAMTSPLPRTYISAL